MKTVPLGGKKAAGRVVLVDDEDYELVMRYRWHLIEGAPNRGGPYARASVRVSAQPPRIRTIVMHILIMGAKGIDHIDHDGLNNQRSNLRIATQTQNGQNRRPNTGATSAFKGVYWNKKKWRASIRVHKKLKHLGSFVSELDAAQAYDAAARKYFGDFACTNFPGPLSALEREDGLF